MFLPRRAVNTSLYAHPKHPCFVRSWEEHPTPAELCESVVNRLRSIGVVLEILELGGSDAVFFQQYGDVVLHRINNFAVFGD